MLLALLGLVVMTALMLGWRSFLPDGGARPHVTLRDGVAVLRPPRGRNFMLAGLALAPTLLLVGVLAKIGTRGGEDQFGLALAFGLLALGGWLVLWFMAAEFRQCLRVDARSIERVFAITRLRVTWAEVERIRWNPGSRWFFIVAAGAWLWVPVDFDGIADFAQLALVCLPPAVLRADPDIRPVLEELASAPPLSQGGVPLG
jgi:uncharacterized membrane protein (GlpM family)